MSEPDLIHFKEIEIIGQGSYSKVVKVLLPSDSLTFGALKKRQIKNLIELSEGIPRDVIREFSILKKVSHPNICRARLMKLDFENNEISILLDYYEFDLVKFYRLNSIDESIIKNITFQALKGLDYLHSHRIAHRDIKPSNILLNNKNNVVLTDFGFSRTLEIFSAPYTNRVGSYSYRSPELILGLQSYSANIDIWAMGCSIIELITKDVLFKGKSDTEVLISQATLFGDSYIASCKSIDNENKLINIEIQSNEGLMMKELLDRLKSTVSSECIELIFQMLKVSPVDRVQTKEALQSSWFANFT